MEEDFEDYSEGDFEDEDDGDSPVFDKRFSLEKKTRRAETVKKELSAQKTEGGVFSKATLDAVGKLGSEGAIDRIICPIATGKEADVFRGECGGEDIAIKIYRMASASYFKNPTVLSYIIGDERFKKVKKTPSALLGCWTRKEFSNLKKAATIKGVLSPEAISFEKNVIVMEFVGKDTVACPKLKHVELDDPHSMFETVIEELSAMWKAGFVHADLSEYNILVKDGAPWLIDFGQGVLKSHPMAESFLERDIRNVCAFFKRKGVSCDAEEEIKRITFEQKTRTSEE